MRQSEKLKLWLPEGSDPLEISKLSENFEKLDPLGGGLETLKEGTGPGSLFMVSKYYKEPIQNAVLCNGGTVDGGEYPELANILGLAYGGSVSSELINSQYGITSTYGYPRAYNYDNDFFVASSIINSRIVIYKKNAAPQIVSIPSTINWMDRALKNDDAVRIITYGRYIVFLFQYTSTNGVVAWTSARYDVTAGKWLTSAENGITPVETNINVVLDAEEFVAYRGTVSGSIAGILALSKNNAKTYGQTVVKDSTGTAIAPVLIVNYDDSPDYVYFTDSGMTAVYRVSRETILSSMTNGGTAADHVINVNAELVASGSSGDAGISWAVIFDGYLYGGMTNKLCSRSISGSSLGSTTTAYTTSSGSAYYAGPTFTPIKVSDNVLVGYVGLTSEYSASTTTVVTTENKKEFILYKGKVTGNTISNGTYRSVVSTKPTMRCAKNGLYGNYGISTIKLPTITLSESLVYMRTGDGATE